MLSIGPFPGPISKPTNDPSFFTIVTLLTPPIFKTAIDELLLNLFITLA